MKKNTLGRIGKTMGAVFLVAALLLTSGCSFALPEQLLNLLQPTEATAPTGGKLPVPTATTPSNDPLPGGDADASLVSLRQAMVGTSQLFAVAYFGYHDNWDSDEPVDPISLMQSLTPELCRDLPFLLEISGNRILGEYGDLFCIVPLDPDAHVSVSLGTWDDAKEECVYEKVLYAANSGEPILVFCNGAGWEPDTQVLISGPSGRATWYPQADDNLCAKMLYSPIEEESFLDFSAYREILAARYASVKTNVEWEGVLPTEETLIGNTWTYSGYQTDGREIRCSVAFDRDVLTVHWNDGISGENYVYENASWELTQKDGYAVLSIDFREFAGVLRYNILYSEFLEDLYVAMDVLQQELPIGWEPLYRNLRKSTAPEPAEMAGSWELAWTELEGYREEAEAGTAFLEITTDYEGAYWISFTDYAFPEENFEDKELTLVYAELYYGCGNDQWMATVNHTGPFGTEYNLTLLEDGTLLLQRYWEVEGMPMVSYGAYCRAD